MPLFESSSSISTEHLDAILFRPAQSDDALRLAKIHEDCWRAQYTEFLGKEHIDRIVAARCHPWPDRFLNGELDQDELIVAERDGDLLAFTQIGPDDGSTNQWEIRRFYTAPPHWGTGVAHYLMKQAIASLRARDEVTRAVLWTWHGPTRARRFYRRAGLAETGLTQVNDWIGSPQLEVQYGCDVSGR